MDPLGVVVRVTAGQAGTNASCQGVEDAGARLAEPESVEHLAGGVAVEAPVEQHRTVTEPAPGAGVATGDVTVDRRRQCDEHLAHVETLSEFLQETPKR